MQGNMLRLVFRRWRKVRGDLPVLLQGSGNAVRRSFINSFRKHLGTTQVVAREQQLKEKAAR